MSSVRLLRTVGLALGLVLASAAHAGPDAPPCPAPHLGSAHTRFAPVALWTPRFGAILGFIYTANFDEDVSQACYRRPDSRAGIDVRAGTARYLEIRSGMNVVLDDRSNVVVRSRVHGFLGTEFHSGSDPVRSDRPVEVRTMRTSAETSLLHRLHGTVYLGALVRIGGSIFGDLGEHRAVGPGTVLRSDTRRSVTFPETGHLLDAELVRYLGISGFPSFTAFSLDVRGYVTLVPGVVLATRALARAHAGPVPLGEQCALGGPMDLRAFSRQRFRDVSCALLQEELRFPLDRVVRAAVFVEVGQVAPSPAEALHAEPRGAVGLGLRVRHPTRRQVGARIDMALGTDGSPAFYLGLGEAF